MFFKGVEDLLVEEFRPFVFSDLFFSSEIVEILMYSLDEIHNLVRNVVIVVRVNMSLYAVEHLHSVTSLHLPVHVGGVL